MFKSTNLFLFSIIATVLLLSTVSSENAFAGGTENMFISAANSSFDNSFVGPMIVEVVIIDSEINDLDDVEIEPDVTVNGKELRMVQAIDGNWYAYFAARDMAQIADSTVGLPGFGLDYGEFCQNTSMITGIDLSTTTAFTIPRDIASASNGDDVLGICDTEILSSDVLVNHVVRESKQINNLFLFPEATMGQVGLNENAWPFIQLYDFTLNSNVDVIYHKTGNTQATTLQFVDENNLVDYTIGGFIFSNGEEVHVTLTDFMLNIDPTDEDSWTFGTNQSNPITMYQAFDENGVLDADGTAGAVNLHDVLFDLFFIENGILLLNPDTQQIGIDVVNLEDNENQAIIESNSIADVTSVGGSFPSGSMPVTFTETMTNSGIFINTDDENKSNIVISSDAPGGSHATIDYNENPNTILVIFEPKFCNDMTIDELIASENYNVIDNRNGYLDGTTITGTNGDDLILASDAGNIIKAKKGNDCVIGGAGDDELRGGNGDDIIFGLGGNDLLIGGKSNDVLYGGDGHDQINGSANNDQLFGENGDDNLKGNSGDDALSCGMGTDIANGGRGTDTSTADCETIKKAN